jgi:predicted RNase H-like HicB family nuclease
MTFTIEFEREDDGRWLAEVLELPGVLAYGQTSDDAIAKAEALALLLAATTEASTRFYSHIHSDQNTR